MTHRTASGKLIEPPSDDCDVDILELVDAPPAGDGWFPCEVYDVDGGSVLVVNEATSAGEHESVAQARVPEWATALVAAALMSAEDETPQRLSLWRVDGALEPSLAAFCAACGAYDEAFLTVLPIDCFARFGDHVYHVRAVQDGERWSGDVDLATPDQVADMAQWRYYPSVLPRRGWGGWSPDGFQVSDHLYEVAGMVQFGIVPLDDLAIAVVQNPIEPAEREQLRCAARPPWIDVLVTSTLTGVDVDAAVARIDVDLVLPPNKAAPAELAAAVALSFHSHGRFDTEVTACFVHVLGEEIRVTCELDWPLLRWTVATKPAALLTPGTGSA